MHKLKVATVITTITTVVFLLTACGPVSPREHDLEATLSVLQTQVAQGDQPPLAGPSAIPAVATEVSRPATVPADTPLPLPSVTPQPDTPPDTILEAGQTWRQGGAEITLRDLSPMSTQVATGMTFNLLFTNRKPQEISIGYSASVNFFAVDNLGRQLVIKNIWPGATQRDLENQTRVVGSGQTINLAADERGVILINADIGDNRVTEIIFTVSGVSTITQARWRIPVHH